MTREIILDTETTGLEPADGHRIVEIGALEMLDKVLTGRSFHCYINPERDMPEEAYKIHGIASEFLKDKPLFKDIASDFLNFIKDGTLVIHNAAFDIRFLNHELSLLSLNSLELDQVVDTIFIAKKKFAGARVNLDALCKRFKIDNSSRKYHGALKDAELLAKVYIELTGGRQIAFVMQETKKHVTSSSDNHTAVIGNGVIIRATSEELLLHKQFLQRLQ